MKTVFTFRNGTRRVVPERTAKALHKIHLGTYETRDMKASKKKPVKKAETKHDPIGDAFGLEDVEPGVVGEPDDLDAMDIEELRQLAEDRGVAVHHRAGVEKLKAALRGE